MRSFDCVMSSCITFVKSFLSCSLRYVGQSVKEKTIEGSSHCRKQEGESSEWGVYTHTELHVCERKRRGDLWDLGRVLEQAASKNLQKLKTWLHEIACARKRRHAKKTYCVTVIHLCVPLSRSFYSSRSENLYRKRQVILANYSHLQGVDYHPSHLIVTSTIKHGHCRRHYKTRQHTQNTHKNIAMHN